ncbi:hypothetical protein RhiirA1_412126 [Rhizophagus irregularis]|uniref:Uncharacterized protein n=1 Tax=Rhizophagus irregularis TaxID=588596 RepID=A0A2N0S9E1_9GLOM|nr:hypothetical protein RhiirA1_412126 [Rhizophagus irregularis]CAB4494378.1 unnamed protein product [Rhizophagus irregularis]
MEGSSSNSNYVNPRYKSYDKHSTRHSNYNNYNNHNAQHNLDYNDDYLLFIWLASLKRFEEYLYLFIIVWNSIKIDNDRNIDRSLEFNDEVGQMKNHIEDLFTNSVINKQELEKYSTLLDDYRDHCYNDFEAKKVFVHNALSKLEKCGISKYKHQLNGLKALQKRHVRQMILDRMESFVDISSQSHIVDEEENDLSVDNPIELRKEIESLRKQNIKLVQENSHYQATLGKMTNTRLSDQDPNNATQLISDIKELQHLLEEFTIVQGPDYKINEKKSMELFSKNKCQANFSMPNAKLILGGILQKCVILQILENFESYFKNFKTNKYRNNTDDVLEFEILNTTERLTQCFNHFNEKRPGKDDITQTIPTKIRQQICASLGSRGFSNENHPLIVETAKKIRDSMNIYREITDPDILDEIDTQSIQITHKVISIFIFRLKTQQIEPKYHFFKSGDEIDTRLMQGSWREEVKKSEVVEVCYFPCILIQEDNKSNQKILVKAQVYTRPKNTATSATGGSSSVFDMFKNIIK